jgi:hypothetical protein
VRRLRGDVASKRNLWLWYLLSIVTLGIAGLVWYYKINKDAKRLAANKGWSPALSVAAVTLGSIIIVPLFVSVWRTWSRVRVATDADGMSAGIQFCLCFIPVVSLAYFGYLQWKLNWAIDTRLAPPLPAVRGWKSSGAQSR